MRCLNTPEKTAFYPVGMFLLVVGGAHNTQCVWRELRHHTKDFVEFHLRIALPSRLLPHNPLPGNLDDASNMNPLHMSGIKVKIITNIIPYGPAW